MDYRALKLTDYQCAEAFGDTLSSIYREKMQELDTDLQPVYDYLELFNLPRYTDFERWFARQTLPLWAKERLKAIEDMKRIRALHLKMKRNPDEERLNVEKARSVPITSIYPFKKRGTQVSCPLHKDDHPSASIKYNKLVCWSCGARHDGIALFMALNDVGFKQAVEAINKL